MINVIHGQIYSNDFSKLEQLAKDFCSCKRYCFNRFQKDKLKFKDIRIFAKQKYLTLNARQSDDACLQGQTCLNVLKAQQKLYLERKQELEEQIPKVKKEHKKLKLQKQLKYINRRINNPKIIFGGRKFLSQLKSGLINKDEWTQKRDGEVYSRGDKTLKGNPNIRIVNNKLRITIKDDDFQFYDLFIPNKFKSKIEDLINSRIAYNIRLKRQDANHWKVFIDYSEEVTEPTIDFADGTVGVDTNPDRIAVCNVSSDGNYINSKTLIESRLKDGSTNKRDYDISCLVKQVIQVAKDENKGIAFEDLKFKKDSSGTKKSNRMKSNFVWKKFITLLERKCIKNGICYRKVNPAYTSLIGNVKYKNMYGLTIHESAAFTIGRRGLGFNEKISVRNCPATLVKESLLGTHAGKYKKKRIHNWAMWGKIKAVLTGQRNNMHNLQELCDHFRFGSETLSGKDFFLEQIERSKQDLSLVLGK